MKTKTYLILGGVAIVFLLLMFRVLFTAHQDHDQEREWFAHNLKYEFSARVDSVRMFNATTGRLYARIVGGDPHTYREDSLKNSLKKHVKLQLISKHRNDSITFVLYNANLIKRYDSIRVSSTDNSITAFRSGKKVTLTTLSGSLNGWGKPPIGN